MAIEFTFTLKNGKQRNVTLTNDDLDAICGDHIAVKWVREQVAFMAMGFAGMAEHRYLTRDWIAADTLYCDAYNQILRMAGSKAALEIAERLKAAVDRHAVAATSR